jgi:Fur family ferric uptake transcriptional regulator
MKRTSAEKSDRAAVAESRLEDYLKSRSIRQTQARRAVLQAVLDISEHFEAEQLFYFLRQNGESVGKATVYRTLPLLVDCGILKQVRLEESRAHYELAVGEDPHDHMVCRRCGRIVEFSSKEIESLRKRIAEEKRFHAIGHRFQISGLCWECTNSCPAAIRL